MPSTESEWTKIAKEFNDVWNFPMCVGALDGKHVTIKPPPHSGSYYFTYKHTFSVVLLALVDANCKFLFVDVGTNGRISDGGVFRNSQLSGALETNSINLPKPEMLPAGTVKIPHLIVADDAFPLKPYIMKPFSRRDLSHDERIFNYRLSRARRIVENAFGILGNRFRVFLKPIPLCPENVELVVLAACSLHNFLRSRSVARSTYLSPGIADLEDDTHHVIPGLWRQSDPKQGGWSDIGPESDPCYERDAKGIRDELCRFFQSPEGKVSWQEDMI